RSTAAGRSVASCTSASAGRRRCGGGCIWRRWGWRKGGGGGRGIRARGRGGAGGGGRRGWGGGGGGRGWGGSPRGGGGGGGGGGSSRGGGCPRGSPRRGVRGRRGELRREKASSNKGERRESHESGASRPCPATFGSSQGVREERQSE